MQENRSTKIDINFMISENNQKFSEDSKQELEPSNENLAKEGLPSTIENYFNNLKYLKGVSSADTQEALNLITDSQVDFSPSLLKEKAIVIKDIEELDAKKTNLISESEEAFQIQKTDPDSTGWPDAGDVDEADIELSNQLTKLPQEKEALKNRELKILATVSYQKIKDHATSLGMEIGDFPKDKIDFQPRNNFNLGVYDTSTDDIKVNFRSAKVIMHEELHFAGAIDNRSGRKNAGNNRLSKTGFHSYWKVRENKKKKGENRDLFRSLNEAVTEKMAEEIFRKSKESIISDLIKIEPDIAESHDGLVEKERVLTLQNYLKYLPDKYKAYTENIFLQDDENLMSFEDLVTEEKKRIESNFKLETFEVRSREMINDVNTYKNEIKILEAILKKLAKTRAESENIPFDEAMDKEWQDMQRAYLKGETIYLRHIEKLVGPNILREFNEIDIRKVDRQEETVEDYRNKVNNLIKRIN